MEWCPGFMLARLDKPLRHIGAVKMAEAQLGGMIVAIASKDKPWNRRVHKVAGQAPGVVDPGRRGGIRSQCGRAENIRYLFQLLARASMGAVQYRVPAVLVLDAAR